MGLIDIIVLALVLAFVVSRFTKFKLPKDPRDTATRRSDLERLRGRPLVRDDEPNVVDITPVTESKTVGKTADKAAGQPEAPKAPRKPSLKELQEQAKGLSGMAKIKVLEPGFDEAAFLEGAKGAYTYFNTRWNARDEDGLHNLCAPGLFDRLVPELHDDKTWQPITIDEITNATVAGARVHGKTVVMDVDFTAVEREGKGAPVTRTSRWVLARPLASEDPNWELQDIKTGMNA